MNALEQWKKLNMAINVKHYIGPNAHKCIEDALTPEKPGAKSPSESKPSTPKLKTTVKEKAE